MKTKIALLVCTVALMIGDASSAGATAGQVGYYYPPDSYYRIVCRSWWAGCRWEPGFYGNYFQTPPTYWVRHHWRHRHW
jgi:hypothetical protein